jgi:hypothetical protein
MNRNEDTKIIVRTFFAWQEEKEEKWLREMSNKGWHLNRVGFFNYKFKKGRPVDMVYKFDFKILRKSEMDDYIMMFKDSGWEHIGNFGSWFYFRTDAKGDHGLELYSDNRSMIEKYRRLLLVLGVISFPVISFSLPNLYMRIIDMAADSVLNNPIVFNIYLPFVILLTIVELVVIYAAIRIFLIIRRLRKDIRQ